MPLMALDKKLQGQYIHEPAHDLESLLQTILAIVCFNNGACGVARSADDSVPTSRWFNEVDRDQLHKDKTIDLLWYDAEIGPHLTEYWKPFAPFLRRLVNVTWPQMRTPLISSPTHQAYIDILKDALKAMHKIDDPLAPYANIRTHGQKRARNKDDDKRYPYPSKYSRSNDPNHPRIPRPVVIKAFTCWRDSVDA